MDRTEEQGASEDHEYEALRLPKKEAQKRITTDWKETGKRLEDFLE